MLVSKGSAQEEDRTVSYSEHDTQFMNSFIIGKGGVITISFKIKGGFHSNIIFSSTCINIISSWL